MNNIHAADAGDVINPIQGHRQVEAGTTLALEGMDINSRDQATNRRFREYHFDALPISLLSSIPFADTFARPSPTGANPMSESPINPLSAALSNAIRDATGHANQGRDFNRQIARNEPT